MPQKTCYYVDDEIEQYAPQTKYVLIEYDPKNGSRWLGCYMTEAGAEYARQEREASEPKIFGGFWSVMPYANRSEVVEVQTRFGNVWHKKPRVRKSK